MKLWLDDERSAPEGWVHATSVALAKVFAGAAYALGEFDMCSLDHDLGQGMLCKYCGKEIESSEVTYVHKSSREALCVRSRRCYAFPARETDGIAFVDWMAETGNWPKEKPLVHSMNPAGRMRMQSTIDRYWRNPAAEEEGLTREDASPFELWCFQYLNGKTDTALENSLEDAWDAALEWQQKEGRRIAQITQVDAWEIECFLCAEKSMRWSGLSTTPEGARALFSEHQASAHSARSQQKL